MGIAEDCKLNLGSVTGAKYYEVLKYPLDKGFSIPEVNWTSSFTIDSRLEAAQDSKSFEMIQLSNTGSVLIVGKKFSKKSGCASIANLIAGAYMVKASTP